MIAAVMIADGCGHLLLLCQCFDAHCHCITDVVLLLSWTKLTEQAAVQQQQSQNYYITKLPIMSWLALELASTTFKNDV